MNLEDLTQEEITALRAAASMDLALSHPDGLDEPVWSPPGGRRLLTNKLIRKWDVDDSDYPMIVVWFELTPAGEELLNRVEGS